MCPERFKKLFGTLHQILITKHVSWQKVLSNTPCKICNDELKFVTHALCFKPNALEVSMTSDLDTRARKDFRMKFAMVEWVTTIMVISIRYVLHMLIRFVLDGAQRFAYVDSEMGSEPQNYRDVFSFSFFLFL